MESGSSVVNLMARMASSSWKDDEELKTDLEKYVSQNLKRSEILDFVKRDFPEYAWSIATLDRRLLQFGIRNKIAGIWNKIAVIIDHMVDSDIDICTITETWLKECDSVSIA